MESNCIVHACMRDMRFLVDNILNKFRAFNYLSEKGCSALCLFCRICQVTKYAK